MEASHERARKAQRGAMLTTDKQLSGIRLADTLEKRRLEQALNVKEFAVLTGISYSTARAWFRLAGFPQFQGVVFWSDFAQWRTMQNGLLTAQSVHPAKRSETVVDSSLPPQALKILRAG